MGSVLGAGTGAELGGRQPRLEAGERIEAGAGEVLEGRWRRAWQVMAALLGFIFLLPLSGIIAIAIRLTSPGPVLYRGQRIGRGLRPFTIFKFRTLQVGAEARIGRRLLRPGESLYTPVGRFLKRTKLDEIPQLINVVRGDMNLVGPRPIRPVFLAGALRDIPNYAARFAVRPGMTGLAQLRGGYFTDPRDKLRYDLLYIQHRSLWVDLKLVLLTFVKLLNRWLTLGLFLVLLFLSASFAPSLFRAPLGEVVGVHFSPLEAVVLLAGAVILVRRLPAHRLYLYRSPVNWPIAAFVAFGVVSALADGESLVRLRDLAYYVASGFLLVFLVINAEMNLRTALAATRVAALVAVAISLLGIFEIALAHHVAAAVAGGADSYPRVSSTFTSPVLLATYLVLSLPLLLAQLSYARPGQEREFWLVCTTVVLVGVLLTQTRLGLLALAIAGSTFLARVSRRGLVAFVAASVFFVAAMAAVGVLRLSPDSLAAEWSRRVGMLGELAARVPVEAALLGHPDSTRHALAEAARATAFHPEPGANMHLTLMLRAGVIGWALMMWVIGAALYAIYRGQRRVVDPRLRMILWAIFSSVVGFLVSMANSNVFYYPTIQLFFWSLLGLGLGIVTHLNGRRPGFNVIWRFGAGE